MLAFFSRGEIRRLVGICLFGLGLMPSLTHAREAGRGPDQSRQIVVRLSRDVFAPLVENAIDKTTPVSDFILGTRVNGKARTTGMPKLDLQPDPHRASFIITLRGTTVSRTTGRNGPAIVQTRADTQFAATKRITFMPGTGFVAEPARINTRTRITTEGIGATRRGFIGRIVVRRASQQVAASRSQVEAIARQRAETRITAAFDEYLATRLAQVNKTLDMRPAIALLLGAESDPHFAASTTTEYMQLVASSAEMPAPAQLPAYVPNAGLVQIWVHQSVFGDPMMPVLELLEQVQPAANRPGRALEVAGALIKQLGLTGSTDETPFTYERADDWYVIQMGGGTGPKVPAATLTAKASSTAPPANAGNETKPSAAAALVAATDRLWTSLDGRFTCVACMLSATPEAVTLKRSTDGKIVTVPIARLSEADRRMLP